MIGASKFENENVFSVAFAQEFVEAIEWEVDTSEWAEISSLKTAIENQKEKVELFEFFKYLSKICVSSVKPIVLMIDEVDSATNNQVFLDFLAQLRGYYIKRNQEPHRHFV